MKFVLYISVLLSLFVSENLYAQNDTIPTGYVVYTPAFKFKDGVFLNFEQVKNNAPLPKTQIVTDVDYGSFDFYDKLFENETMAIYDNLGVKKEIEIDKIWGFSDKGILYINLHEEFNRIPVFGNISHFIANKTYTDYNPYNYSRPNTYYNSTYYNDQSTKTVLMQYILDFESGKIFDFNYKSVELLISKDIDLYGEFIKLSKRKKKKLKFVYLRKYNTKHPVYLPK